MAAPCAEPWTVEGTRDWMDKAPTSTHDLSIWPSSSLRRWHPRSSVPLVLTRHSSPIINERWTRVINLSMFFLLCYGLLTTILRSRAPHRVLLSAIQYARRSYMLSGLYRKVKTFRSDLLTYLLTWMVMVPAPPWRDLPHPRAPRAPIPVLLCIYVNRWVTIIVRVEVSVCNVDVNSAWRVGATNKKLPSITIRHVVVVLSRRSKKGAVILAGARSSRGAVMWTAK